MKTGAVAASLLVLVATTFHAQAEEIPGIGPAMEIISKSGIDTASAVVKLKQNGEDVKRFATIFSMRMIFRNAWMILSKLHRRTLLQAIA